MTSCQEFVVNAIKGKMMTGQELDWIKHIATDSRLLIQEYPAVVVESEPFDYNQLVKNDRIALVKDACNIIVLVKIISIDDEVRNLNEMTDDDLSRTKKNLKEKSDSIIKILIDDGKVTNNISLPEFGRADDDIISIDSQTIMILTIPASIYTKNDFSNS